MSLNREVPFTVHSSGMPTIIYMCAASRTEPSSRQQRNKHTWAILARGQGFILTFKPVFWLGIGKKHLQIQCMLSSIPSDYRNLLSVFIICLNNWRRIVSHNSNFSILFPAGNLRTGSKLA